MNRKALIVEDEQDLGAILAEHLRLWGFEPTLHLEGKNVIEWTRRNRPTVILLDLMLPDIDGYTICETLKLDRDTNLIPVIMTTALSDREDKVRLAGRGQPLPHQTIHRRNAQPIDSGRPQPALESLRPRHAGGVRFHLQSDTNYLEELNHLLGSLFLFSGMAPQQIKQFTTAVGEIGTNAIEWGHKKQIDRIVTVDYHIDPEKITIDIKDTGPGFNPTQPPPRRPAGRSDRPHDGPRNPGPARRAASAS